MIIKLNIMRFCINQLFKKYDGFYPLAKEYNRTLLLQYKNRRILKKWLRRLSFTNIIEDLDNE